MVGTKVIAVVATIGIGIAVMIGVLRIQRSLPRRRNQSSRWLQPDDCRQEPDDLALIPNIGASDDCVFSSDDYLTTGVRF